MCEILINELNFYTKDIKFNFVIGNQHYLIIPQGLITISGLII